MLNWIYHVAFDAQAEITNWMADEEHGIVEGYFVGKHIGDFAGTAPTGRKVRVPLCRFSSPLSPDRNLPPSQCTRREAFRRRRAKSGALGFLVSMLMV